MNRPPIWLLPMLYRLWAAGRAQLFARWRTSWPGGDGGFGAEELAWQLALDLETAEAMDEDVCGAALDWRKAFDNAPSPACGQSCTVLECPGGCWSPCSQRTTRRGGCASRVRWASPGPHLPESCLGARWPCLC